MIVTMLVFLQKLIEFARKRGEYNDSFVIDLIESSYDSFDSLMGSMIIFLNCNTVQTSHLLKNSFTENSDNESVSGWFLRKKSYEDSRLNSIKKMECEEENHKDLKHIITGLKGNLISPPSDCNSNNLTMPKEHSFLCSTESLQDYPDFLQDNSDYQWFLDYGYKDNNSHHQSILYLLRSQDLGYYDDMAKNIDANLAEVDMDDFNREDINSVLSTLPNMQDVGEREMFASVTGSMMVKFDFDSFSPRCNSQEEQINTSICKSKLLFSPVHESYIPNGNLSVDSLDISENDINLMVTCQSNKSNYTIAFEGSTVMTSDDSECHETGGNEISGSEEMETTQFNDKCKKNHLSDEGFEIHSSCAMASSDSTFTTWSKIRGHSSDNLQLRLHPSENNNKSNDVSQSIEVNNTTDGFKSLSLPDLFLRRKKENWCMSKSAKLNSELERKSSSGNENRCIKLFDVHNNGNPKVIDESFSSSFEKPPPNFSLVKLFIKQKSASHEGMSSLTTDQFCKKSVTCENNQSKNIKNCKDITTCQINEINSLKTKHCIYDYSSTNIKNKVNEKKLTEFTKYSCQETSISKVSEKLDHNCCCSDESTQENGSNTESAENITCNHEESARDDRRKLSEKSIQTSKLVDTSYRERKVPVYILYPNYSLPNLEFLKKEHYVQNIDFSKIFFRPQKFSMPESPVSSQKSPPKKYGKRPFSVNDIETLKKTGFKHVRDWESLTFLLPKEYKQFLQEIPEILTQLKDAKNSKKETVPLFRLNPSSRNTKKRPNSCDANLSNESRSSNFSSTATQPSSGYKGSSTMLFSNNSNCFKRSGSVSHNRMASVGLDDSSDVPPPRPPLPKGILRNNSLDSQHYTCKTQKEYANKRYSMFELGDKNLTLEEKLNTKPSINSSKLPLPFKNRNSEQIEGETEKKSKVMKTREIGGQSHLEKDMKRLEELLGISAVFGESVESFTERDMMRLRSQVSKFLTMQKNLEKVSETLQTVDEAKANESLINASANSYDERQYLDVKSLQTPHNTPEHKNQANKKRNKDFSDELGEEYLKPCECNGRIHEFEREDCKFSEVNLSNLKKTVSFAEKISFNTKEYERSKERTPPNSPSLTLTTQKQNQIKLKKPIDLPICEESVENLENDSAAVKYLLNSADLLHKRDLILDVKNSVEKILKLCSETSGDPANICLHHLCPSLYAVLSDGLKDEIDTPFGPIRNSVWSVIEASSQQGPMTSTLNELVQRLNRDDIFTEGLIKFNAFIFGLLNARALSGWFSYLRTRDSLLHKYYSSSGLFLLSNTAGAPFRVLVDQLINIIEPLCSLQFNLDLMYQTKLLHCSLQNLNSLLEEPSNNDFLTPTKQFMLLKLVHSIQNSISQSGEGKRSRLTMEDIEQKTSDPPVSHLLEKNKTIRTRRTVAKTRPRSGCDTVGAEEVADVASAMKKRWSGVNLSSKLVEAFDRLIDYSDSENNDSLDIAASRVQERISPTKKYEKRQIHSNSEFEASEADSYTKEQRKNILLNLNKKSGKIEDYKTDLRSKELMDDSSSHAQSGGQKFKRLQQKWERLSGQSASDSDSDNRSPPVENIVTRKNTSSKKFEKASNESNTTATSPGSKISKIPRLVTSPLSSAPSIKSTGNVKKILSPTSLGNSKQKTGKIASKSNSLDGKINQTFGNRLSRCDEKAELSHTEAPGKIHAVRPTSLPYRDASALYTKKTETISRRAASVSLNRKPSAKKLQQAQRTVRTLTHRLPSDSGHLSFNEGERLKVVLEVDKTWLLCCRGTQKGLVPKSAVISELEDNNF